ncbi:tRNA (guanosine(37)-N1)-methyltransferase TrmD [Rhodobacteraceae bacterium NNCM2]|nr:tRNA (guanosine(37)-N1)-methyltransferase TrmD [Coraliihabitans acroporae]
MIDKPRSHGMLRPTVSTRPRPLMGPKERAGAFRAKVLTLFPGLFPGPLGESLTGKALKDGKWFLEAIDIRRFATDKHRTVDDTPSGGGAGMVMKADILAKALDFAAQDSLHDRSRWPVIYLSPRGRPLTQKMAARWAKGEGITLLAGRYEGVDQRVLEARQVEEVSIGDFVLTGGEIPAMTLLDAVIRLLPGVLGNDQSAEEESFSRGLLEHPQYTRPQVWEGREIPEILLSGNHAKIAEWRLSQAERLTQERRPDLWRAYKATDGDTELSGGNTNAENGDHED